MEKTIDGVVYQLVESPEPSKDLCGQCAGKEVPGRCKALGEECCHPVNGTKIWLEKEEFNEG